MAKNKIQPITRRDIRIAVMSMLYAYKLGNIDIRKSYFGILFRQYITPKNVSSLFEATAKEILDLININKELTKKLLSEVLKDLDSMESEINSSMEYLNSNVFNLDINQSQIEENKKNILQLTQGLMHKIANSKSKNNDLMEEGKICSASLHSKVLYYFDEQIKIATQAETKKAFLLDLFDGVVENLKNIDSKIEESLKDWDITRIGDMEVSILRLATFELTFTKTDKAIIINEAVEISKKFTAPDIPSFINGILDSISKKA